MQRKMPKVANNPASRSQIVYRKSDPEHQITFFDFNHRYGMQLDEENEYVKLADEID